ncbi:ESPR-type extended signal peptide-containing protein [Veillonella sp.]|uniref:ESPR-type extended signal peptide-containing protein n=1 Tax=Veillonella sp. TaxID=1926307 RepID=UPI0025F34141|nr:ESPR-type extended signal peptide-containing protein [Veillonella sp.]
MNKIYKVVWSKVRNAYVVVSEIAKSHSKNKSQSGTKVANGLLRAAVVASLVLGGAFFNPISVDATNAWGARLNPDNDNTSVGGTATANGAGAVALGTAKATGADSLALGTDSSATGTETIAIGGATVQADYGIAIGQGSVTGGVYSGTGAIVGTAYNVVAIGLNATAYGRNDVVIGANQNAMTPTFAPSEDTPEGTGLSSAQGGRVMIGHDNIAYGRSGNSVIVGSNNRSNAVHGIAIGQNAYAGQPDGSTLAYENTMSIGTNTRSYSTDTIAMGNNAVAGNTDTTKTSYDGNGQAAAAIGSGAKATSFHTVAVGATSQATDISATAIGDNALASAVSTTAVGNSAQATSIGSLAAGAAALANNQYTIALGNSAQATNLRAMAVGYGAVASGGGAIALGRTSQATASYATSMGYENTASGASSLSVGYHTYAYGTRSIAIGREAVSGLASTGQDTIAIGSYSNTQAANTIAIGNTATTDSSATGAIAIGNTATANVAGSVAIGSGSSTTRATDTTSQGWNNQDSTWSSWLSTKGNAGTTSGGVWNSTAGVVSIGTDGASGAATTRKLTGLAAGQYDTDAVNMKQWTNTMLATTGDFKDSSYTTTYGSDGVPRTATKLLNQSLKITGGVDNTLYYQSDFATQPNIAAVISDNTVTLRLNKSLRGLEAIYLTNPTTGNATTLTGNGITIRPSSGSNVTLTTAGLNNGGNKITNVAAGTAGTDGVNVTQLNQAIAGVSTGSGTTTTVTVEGGTVAGTGGTYTGNNLQITSTTGTNSTTYDLKLADKVTLGSSGTSGTNGSLTVNGTGGSSVAVDGATGSVALTGTDGSTATIAAGPAANDVNGNSINRITAGGATVATLNDGMVYTGDTGSAAVKLNKTVNIVGGETDSTKLSTDNNIGIVAAQDGDNGKLTVRLAKDITGLNTVEAGDAVLGNQGVVTAGGTAQDGSYVTGLDNTSWNVTNPDIVTGRAATEDQLKTVSDAVVAVTDGTSANATGGFGLTDDSGTAVKQDLGKTIQIAGDGNVKTTADTANGKITVGLSNTIGIGTSGSENGTVTVNGADGSAVAINGADGSISLNTGSGSPITIQAGSSVNDVTGTPVNRITVGGQTVATMNDGMKYGGDFGTVSNVKLNNQVDVKGEATTEADLTTGNIGVVSSQAGDNGLLVVKLNKDINLGSTGSVTMGNTVVNNSGLTITGGPSVTGSGIDAGSKQITNVAAGVNDTDAVNVKQLEDRIGGITGGSGKTTNLTVDGGTAAPTDGTYAGSNLQVTATEGTASTTYDLKLADNVTLGSTGDSGVDGSLTVNGKDGESVAINGADGSIALKGTDGSTATIAAGPAANDVNGNSINRVTVGGATVATLDDGMVYTGDTGSAAVKLNKTVNIVGGETDASKLSTDNNIGIVAAQDGDNGKLTVRLAKDITGLNTVTAGDATIGNQTETTASGVAQTGSYVTGLDNTSWNVTNPDIVTGRAATEDQLKTVSDAIIDGTSENAVGGFGLTDDSGTAVKQDLGKTIQIAGDGNVTTTAADGKLTVGLSNTIALGEKASEDGTTEGADSSITVNGKDGSAVAINGADGSISLNTGSGSPITIQAGSSVNDVTGSPVNRITVGGQTVATMNDGMKYGGDFGTVSNVKLNNQVDVKGEATTEADLTTGNIGVVSSQAGDNGLLVVKLNKDIDLGSTGSLTTGATVINNNGVTIAPATSTGKPVTLTNAGLDNGGNKITNVATGTDGTDAVNVDQLTKAIAGVSAGEGSKTNLTVEGGTAAGTGGNYTGSNLQITEKTEITGATTYDVKLADNITLGSAADSAAGTEGTDSSITLNGKDGSAVAINGADGSITLNTGSGSPIAIQAGSSVNDVTGTPVNRITVGGQTVATMNDGMKYGGDFGTVSNVKLNNQVDVKGEATSEADLTTGNIGVVSSQAGNNGLLTVKLNKDINLGSTGSLTFGSGDNTVSLSNSGLNNGGQKITNVAAGTADTDAVNFKQLKDEIGGITGGSGGTTKLTVDGGTAAPTDGTYAGSNLQVTATEGAAITTYDLKLADNVTLGSAGTNGVDGSLTVNGKDGESVAINGADGSIALTGADGSTATIAAGPAANDVNGTSVNRITVGDQTVATLNDGMVYTGDTGSAAVKLNKIVNIVGGETDASKLSTDNNIGIVASQDGDNGKLTVQLAKDITGLNTVEAGTAVLGDQGVVTAGGVAQDGSYVTGLDNTEWNVANPDIVTGRAATEDQLKTVSDAVTAVSDGTSENATGGFGLADGSGTTVKQDLGKTITVKGGVTDGTATTDNPDGVSNITTTVKDGALEVSLNKDLDLGSTGSVTTGNTVVNNDGVKVGDTALTSDGLTITNGPSVTTTGINAGSKQITNVASGSDGVDADGNPTYNNLTNGANIGDIKNITDAAKTELTNDGLNFTADSGDSVHRNLGETLNIAGDGNITTTSDAANGKITVGLSNTIALGEKASEDGSTEGVDSSITVNGKDGSAVTINGADGSIVLNTGSGSPITIQAGSSVNDVTGTPVNRITVDGQTVATMNDGMKYYGDFGAVSNVKLNNQVTVKGEAATEADLTTGNIGVVSSQAGDNGLLVVKLNKDINLGSTGSVTMGNTVVNNNGITITPTTGDPVSLTSSGLDNGNKTITNVAAGVNGTDAVNVTQLEDRLSQIAIGESKTTEITVEGGTAAPTNGTYAGDNLQVKAGTTANGSPTYDVKLADNIVLGSAADSAAGTTGTDGSITLNGADGSSVAVNGADGSVTAKGTDGSAVAINGSNGSIALNTGSGSPVTIQAGTSANNLAGTSVDRITVGGQTVATMSDGLKYAGDDGQTDTTKVIAKNLNEQLDIVGGADATKLTDNNIGVNNVNGQLKVQLVKDINLGDTGSVTVGTAVLGNQTVTTAGGVSQTGTYLTGLSNTAWDTSNPDAVTGRAATEDQLKAINEKVNAISTGTGAFGLTDDSGTKVTQSLGETIQVAGDGNVTTTADATNGKITVGLSNDLSIGAKDGDDGTDGVDGKIGVNGKDGSAVVINGADGSIGLTGPAGADGTQPKVTIVAGGSVNNVDGTPVDRITAGGQTIATMSDGQKYAGDNAKADGTNVIAKKLNEQLDIVGGADATKLTENNIGVNNVNGQLKVQLAQNIDLGENGSVTMDDTVVNNDGMTIGTGDTAVSLTNDGLNNGGNRITNVGAGTADTDAVNYGQLKAAATAVTVEGGTVAGTTDYTGSNLKLKATTNGDKTTYDLKLADAITLGSTGTDGVDGSVTVNGKDGSAVAINGADGSIALTGSDGSTATIAAGTAANDVNGNSINRITAGGATVATLDDGMVYTGDTGSAAVKLNKTVNIVGGETDASKLSTDNNIGIVASQDGDNGKLTVQLAKDITGLNTVTAGTATIGTQTELTAGGIAQTGNYVTGLDNTSWNVTNPDIVSGRAATENQLKTVSDAITDGTSENATGGFGLTDDSGTAVKQDLGKAIQIAGDGNLKTTADAANGKITVGLSNTITLGEKASEDGTTEGADSSITVNGKDGSAVAINGADGSISLNTGSGSPITIQAGSSVNDVTGSPVNRITVGGQTVATMNDGMKYGGDFGTVSNVKLNNQVDVKGEATTEANLTTGNIGVVSSQAGDNGLLTVKLNKDINLGSTGSVTTGATVINNDGVTITPSTGNPVTLTGTGLNNGGNKITNVAAGDVSDTSTDAVNGSQLKSVKDIAEKHTIVTVEDGTAAGTTDYAGSNLKLKATDNNGQTTYDLKLADDITLGSANGADGTGGVDSSITVNGAAGSSVAINGKDGSIGLTGPAGADGTPGATVTIKAGTSANDVTGTAADRITVGDQTVATLNDGMVYTGDTGSAAVKLNKTVNIVGGQTDASKLSTDANIGVVASQDGDNAKLTVQLAKDITGLNTVTAGDATLGNQTITTADGVAETGSYVTGLDNTSWNVADPDIVSGRAATEDQLKTVSDAITDGTSENATGGFGLTDDDGNAVKQDLGKTIQIAGDGNVKTTADAANGKITVGLSNTIALGEKASEDGTTEGADSSITVNGKDGSAVAINGADGSISLNTGSGSPITIQAGSSVNDVTGTPVDRITAGGQTIATLSDGMKYGGDFGTVSNVKLNNQVNVKGEATTEANLTTGNIGVVSSQDGDNGLLTVKLNKDINLGSTGSVTTGATVINNDGVTITPSTGNPVTLTGTGLNNGGNQITNVASGSDGVDADGNPTYNTDTNAANIGDLKNVSDALVNKGMDFTADSGETVHRDLGEALGIVGDGQNITTTTDPTNGNITVALSNDISIGAKDGADGTDGVDGKISVNGKDGSAVVINGADGSIGLTGPAGADGTPGTTVNIKVGPSVDDVTGTPVDRITVGDQTVATLNDGMVYTGDSGSAAVKLNKTVNIVGGQTDASKLSTDANIGVVASQDGDNAKLTVQLAKDITGLNTVEAGTAVIGDQGVVTAGGVGEDGSFVTGLDNTEWNVANPDIVSGRAATENQLKTVSDAVKAVSDGTSENATGGFGLTDDNGNAVKQDLGKTIQIAGDGQNITTTADAENGKITVGLSNNLSIGTKGTDGTPGANGSIAVNGSDGNSVAIDGNDGISIKDENGKDGVSITGKDGVDGVDGLEGHIGLNGKDGMTDIYTTPGQAGVNGQPGDTMTRIIYTDPSGQNHQVATLDDGMKYGGDFGTVSAVKLNNQVNVKGNATNEADLTDGNIGVVSGQDGDNSLLTVKLNKDLNLGSTGSVTMGDTVINNGGVTIGSGTSAVTLTNNGLNNGGNQIVNVASGIDGTMYDTSVKGQENYNNAANIGDLSKAISNVTDAESGGGFVLGADDNSTVKQNLGGTINITGDGNTVTSVKDGKIEVGLNKDVDLGRDGSITAGNTTINEGGVSTNKFSIKDSGISIDKDGINAGDTQIKNVASGVDGIDADGNPTYDTDTNAANIGDIKNIANAAADSVKAQSGKNITVDPDTNKVNLNDNITLGDNSDASKQVNIDGNGATVTAGSGDNQVKMDGSKGQISAGGAVLGNQENTAGDSNPATGTYLTGLSNTAWDGENIQSGRAATEDQLKVVDDKVNKGRVFQGDDGADNSVTVGLGDTLKLNGGANTARLSDGNIGVVRNSSGDGLDIKLAKDLTNLDSVTTGNTTMNSSGITIKTVDADRNITLQDSNINMGNNVVSGVADGAVAPGSTEAINGSQLAQRDQAINSLGGAVNKLDNRINRVGAGAAALAALHPQDFDPDDKWDFAFGYGHYSGANAGALGAFYKPNEDTTFSVGGTIGGGENMFNAGVSFKIGQGNNVSNSRVGMAKEIRSLREDVAKLEDLVNRQSQMINQLTGQNPGTIESKGSQLFPDVPSNHWAYEYENKLHDLGIVEGYPDGNFDGNRMMTRYEFAAVVYRAIMAGAASNAALQGDDTLDRLANEFSDELKYIRIDTVKKDKDGNPTIQRVRIVPENKDKE